VLTTSYTYDALSRLETVTDPVGKVYVHGYDPNGNRESLAFPNGVRTTYTYDPLNRLRSLVAISTATSQLVVSFAYALGPTGNRTQIVEHDGTTRDYQHDDLYRLTDEHVTLAGATRWRNGFVYDPVGNRLRQDRIETTGSERVVLYDYDERDRLLTESSGDSTLYGWDENGNQISKSGPQGATYEWDFENRLRKVALANGTVVEHDYDVDGTRIRTRTTPPTGPPTTIDDLVDPYHQTSAAGRGLVLSQVVVETDAPTGALAAYHVRGDDLLATLRPDDTAPTTLIAKYFHAEGIGSIRALTDELGNVSDRYDFEAFGELLAHDGDDPNAYLFAGEAFDPNVGFYYNRARWLVPNLGLFAGVDPFIGALVDPSSLHKYTYAALDPVRNVDPAGLFSISEKLTAIATQAIVSVSATLDALQIAFTRGDGGAIGRLFNQLGALAQRIALQVIQIFPQIQVGTAQLLQRALDYSLRFGQRFALMEVKYAIPRGAQAFSRLVAQLTEAVQELPRLQGAAQEAQVVLWTYKEPTFAAVRKLYETLGPSVASRVQFVGGVDGLFRWLRFYFRV
jgi:RHS repeat-associated protein